MTLPDPEYRPQCLIVPASSSLCVAKLLRFLVATHRSDVNSCARLGPFGAFVAGPPEFDPWNDRWDDAMWGRLRTLPFVEQILIAPRTIDDISKRFMLCWASSLERHRDGECDGMTMLDLTVVKAYAVTDAEYNLHHFGCHTKGWRPFLYQSPTPESLP